MISYVPCALWKLHTTAELPLSYSMLGQCDETWTEAGTGTSPGILYTKLVQLYRYTVVSTVGYGLYGSVVDPIV